MKAMNTKKLFSKNALVSFLLILSAFLGGTLLAKSHQIEDNNNTQSPPAKLTTLTTTKSAFDIDFTDAAERSVNAVVHVKTKISIRTQNSPFSNDPFFEFFFGQPQVSPKQSPIMGSGSGVIISDDGYIVTNNHVINNADEIEVTLNDNKTYTAEVIGKDPSTDIALIKIDAKNLTTLPYGNSDELKIGEWVLAVGNPFNLTSTVTAGIVSAKARNINILSSDIKIESFIQTDAAVNPGNSGGALVNTKGELVGINTAIASQTGSYTGYSFAVPVSIVSKVVADLKEFGEVQRAVLGVSITDITNELAKEKDIDIMEGAYVHMVTEQGAAKDAGIKDGDIITQVNDTKIKSVAELQEQIGRHNPGDNIKITVIRDKKEKIFDVKLKNKKGSTNIIKSTKISDLGASFEEISDNTKDKLNIASGVKIVELKKGGKLAKSGVQDNFIILKINNQKISNIDDIQRIIKKTENSLNTDNALFLSGIYPDGKTAYYAINLQE